MKEAENLKILLLTSGMEYDRIKARFFKGAKKFL